MKKFLFLGIGTLLFFAGCADKPLATSVIGLAGNQEVVGWDTPSKQVQKPKVIIKRVVEYKYLPLKDNDNDGVPNYLDECPNTPKGLTVDHNGCPILTTLRLNFDVGKWYVKKIYYPDIKKVAEILKANPKLKIEIEGYTDNTGSQKYNFFLSKKRAQAVADILIKKYHINPKRIIVKGYGDKYPLVPNATPTNKALNRRVEIVNISSRRIDPVVYLPEKLIKKAERKKNGSLKKSK